MTRKTKTAPRIGIYSGTFDPVHAGHVSFALQAIADGKVDVVYFLPERRPRSKRGVEHFGHRVAMLQKAVRPHKQLHVLELEDVSFSIATSLPRLEQRFRGAQLVFLIGSDVTDHIMTWPHAERLLTTSELLIGLRAGVSRQAVARSVAKWSVQPQAVHIIESYAASVSSGIIREALRRRTHAPGLLKSVERYSDHNWLYVSVA